jgi:hypothetical protein
MLRSKKQFIGNGPMQWVDPAVLKKAPWRTTYIIKTDLEVLARSMDDYGWLQPLVVQESTAVIIDGNYRCEIFMSLPRLSKATEGLVPVVYVDCDDVEAMLLHGRLNRGRGNVLAKKLSRIVQSALRSKKYGEPDIKRMFAMDNDEMDMMVDGTLLKDKKISEHKYSAAWVPVEAPASAKDTAIVIERPPNVDG